MGIEFERRCWAEIDLDCLRHNFSLVQRQAGSAAVMAVVKANAYGHGDLVTARALEAAGAQRFAVSGLAEAILLRRGGVKRPILLLGYTMPQHVMRLRRGNLTQCIYSPLYAKQMSQAATEAGIKLRVHFKVDTGMGRLGFNAKDNLEKCIDELAAAYALPGLRPIGIFTHYAAADSTEQSDIAYTEQQFKLFQQVLHGLAQRGITFRYAHCCNSAGMIAHPETRMDIVRPGIILYGAQPSSQVTLPGLKPAFKLKTVVTMVKPLAKGESVSYGRIFTAPHDMQVATLAVGYADGYPRLLSDTGVVDIEGKAAPILGRVCMDQMVVDVTHNPAARQGSIATLFGGGAADTVEQMAEKCGTVNYEILCNIGRRVQRVYIEDGRETLLADYMQER